MGLKARKKILLAKTEAVYGTEEAMTGGANAILTRGLATRLMQGPTEQRDLDRVALGGDKELHVSPFTGLDFQVEAASSGAAGTAPAWAPILMACGFAETITASTDAQYDPVSAAFESLTMGYYNDGNEHMLLGARGNATLDLSAGQIPHFGFAFDGLRVAPDAVALPSPTLSAFKSPLPITNANTPTFTLHGVASKLLRFQLDIKNQIVHRDIVGCEEVVIVDRAVEATIVIEETLQSVQDWHAIIAAHTEGALVLTHGNAAGEIVQVDGGQVQLTKPQLGETDGITTLQMTAKFNPTDAGDDEVKITVK